MLNYIIFDLEWNQPPDETAIVTQPFCLEGEIIEIGAVKLNDRFELVDDFCAYVTPKFYPKMHKRIATLTGIHDRTLAEKGMPFPEMHRQFLQWCGEEYAFMTWSMSDLPVLIDNMLIHGIDVSNLPECYDIQRIFSREIMRGSTRYSLDTALSILKEKGEVAHDALHDARNTAKVCNHLDLEQYLGEYAARVFAEQPDPTVYETRQQLLQAQALRQFTCPWCEETVMVEQWLGYLGNTSLGYGLCPQEDEFFVELTVKRHPKGGFCAQRLIYEMSDDLWDVYMDRKEALGV